MATVVEALRDFVISLADASVLIGGMSLMELMAVVFPAPTGPVKIILY
jgi:hypothetical protein